MLSRHVESIMVVLCIIFLIVISMFHLSDEGFMGLSYRTWKVIWAIAENGFALMMCGIVSLYSYGVLRTLFTWVFIPYFIIKLIYQFSCFSHIKIISAHSWENVWSLILVVLIISSLYYCAIKIKKQ